MTQEEDPGMLDAAPPAVPEASPSLPRAPRRARPAPPAPGAVPAAPEPADAEPGAPERTLPPAVAEFLAKVPPRLATGSVRGTVTRGSVPRRAGVSDQPVLSTLAQKVWDLQVFDARQLARKYRTLEELWCGPDEDPEPGLDGDCNALIAAEALRMTYSQAQHVIREAHCATANFPRCLELLEEGRFPASWFPQMLQRTRKLRDVFQQGIDEIVSRWCLDVTPETFARCLRSLVRWAETLQEKDQEERPVRRAVDVEEIGGGLSCMTLTGPTPEILSTARRLDVAARAVQAAQRAALREGTPVPWDPDGQVAQNETPLSLATLRYLLATRAQLDTDGVDIPADRFRIQITVPILSLLGISEAPGVLDGSTPVPAELARALAGGENLWYRVLTDPCTGAFAPLPEGTYRPTRPMLEHLRLRGPQCAVPGCARSASIGAECDHIEEFLGGGATDVENLHWLCWFHHQEKTEGLLDPERLRPVTLTEGGIRPGVTRWLIGSTSGHHVWRDVQDEVDLIGTLTVQALEQHYLAHGPKSMCDHECRHFGAPFEPIRLDEENGGKGPPGEDGPPAPGPASGSPADPAGSAARPAAACESPSSPAPKEAQPPAVPGTIDPDDPWGRNARRRPTRPRDGMREGGTPPVSFPSDGPPPF